MREQELIDFGKKLKKIRNDKKLELKKLSELTKININYLKKIEEGQFDFLPKLYVRSFLKLYVQQLGEDWQGLLQEYDAIKAETNKSEEIKPDVIKTEKIKSEKPLKVTVITDEDLKKTKKPGHLHSQILTIIEKIKPYLRQMNIIWFALGVIIIFFAIYSLLKEKNDQPIISAGGVIGESLIEPQSILPDTIAPSQDEKQVSQISQNLNLELKALETTWLQIIVDDSIAKELTFDSGTAHSWQAKEKFKLRVGNAAGIRLFLNGRDLGKLGDSGEVIKFDLTEAGIQSSSL